MTGSPQVSIIANLGPLAGSTYGKRVASVIHRGTDWPARPLILALPSVNEKLGAMAGLRRSRSRTALPCRSQGAVAALQQG